MHAILSLLYLAAPYFLFFFGWLWWPYAIVLEALLAVSVARAVRVLARDERLSWKELLPEATIDRVMIAAVTLFFLYLSGVGGMGNQQPDWLKHNAVIAVLTDSAWPSRFGSADGAANGSYLTYYIAYYLPAVVMGKWFGLLAAHLALFAWTFAGMWLAALWVIRLVGSRSWIVWAVWWALSGMDVLGVLLRGGGEYGHFWEWYPRFGAYSSNVSLLIWVPQHMLPGWIATGLIMARAEERGDGSVVPLAAALTGLWSPFVTIGLVPIALFVLLRTGWRSVVAVMNVAGPAIFTLVTVAYLSTVNGEAIPRGWNFILYPWLPWTAAYLAVLALEVVFLTGLTLWLLRKPVEDVRQRVYWSRGWIAVVILVLSLLPLYRLGFFNDIMMRSSIPAYFILWIVILRMLVAEFSRAGGLRWQASLLLACLMIGAIQPISQFGGQVPTTRYPFHFFDGKMRPSVGALKPWIRDQYLGRPDTFFSRHLAP